MAWIAYFLIERRPGGCCPADIDHMQRAQQLLARARAIAPDSDEVFMSTVYWLGTVDRGREVIEIAQPAIQLQEVGSLEAMGQAARNRHHRAVINANGVRMPQQNDLSRSLTPFEQATTLVAVIELSLSSWLIAGTIPGIERQPLKKIAPDETELLRVLHRWRDEAIRKGRTITRIAVAFEAGRDGFWLARWLTGHGIEAHIIHSSSVAVSREHRRAKTDRLDTAHADAGVPGMVARRTRPLRHGRDPDDRGRGRQAAEP